ncbi:hypothetical protein [Halostreptopolyspora alba]|uniref:Uncharacterized protein n=1 Tax=Halostreptopolyspora alba TaxID=2487137 RepID=A0A3N0E8S5_9ACTN|nr:hypothetical protein EFW17_13585 [Nocardiopsaceae bacterium YIM 96095]
MLALACGAYATLLPRTGRVVFGIAITALVVLVLYQMNRVIAGDPFGVLGLAYGLTVLILLLLPSSRAFIRR